ncbi:hypothetical protein EON81_19745 [bacterium]|nr:MAG: hypothetical protein EON81_19745 [bacterium]
MIGVEAFRDALAKGLGRTMIAVREPGGSERYADALIEAFVVNQNFDGQFETGRAPYLWRLVQAALLEEPVLAAILAALPSCEDRRDREQMIELLGEYLKAGEERAWDGLESLARNGDEEAQDRLAKSGERGLLWAEKNVLPNLPEEDRSRMAWWLPNEVSDNETEVQRRLRKIYQGWESIYRKDTPSPELSLTSEQFLTRLKEGTRFWSASVRFALNASEDEFREAVEIVLSNPKRGALQTLRRMTRYRAFPTSPARLFSLVDDEESGWIVCQILGLIVAPEVREFGLRLVERRPLPLLPYAASLDKEDRHNVVSGFLELFRSFPEGDWQLFAEWIYEESPCSICRGSAVSWMRGYGEIPAPILEEIPFDGEPDVIEAAE